MEKKTWARDKNERNATELGQRTRNSKPNHYCNRKSRVLLRQWETSDEQFNKKGIEEYKCNNNRSECCSDVYIVIPTGEDVPSAQEKFATLHPEKVLVSKSEYDISEPDSSIFAKDSIGYYLYQIQSKTCRGEKYKSTRTTGAQKSDKGGSSQKRVFKQTYRESPVVAIKNLASDTIIPQKESFETLISKPRSIPRSGGKHRQQNLTSNAVFSPTTSSRSNSDEQVSCPSHVYTFNRGLVPSREAHSLELLHASHFLPPVVADRIGSISEHKHYKLSLEKGGRNSNNANCFLNALYSYDKDEKSLGEKIEPKSIVYKEFSAETIIPAPYGKRRYFDFQGYIEFLCKERDLRKTSAKQLDRMNDNDWRRLESSPWLNNLSNVLVKDVYDYSKILDIKGSRMKIDENPAQMKYQSKSVSESHQYCCLGKSNNVYIKPHRTKVTQLKKRKPKEKTVLIERLPSKFQFTFPGRPPSSDDSGFTE